MHTITAYVGDTFSSLLKIAANAFDTCTITLQRWRRAKDYKDSVGFYSASYGLCWRSQGQNCLERIVQSVRACKMSGRQRFNFHSDMLCSSRTISSLVSWWSRHRSRVSLVGILAIYISFHRIRQIPLMLDASRLPVGTSTLPNNSIAMQNRANRLTSFLFFFSFRKYQMMNSSKIFLNHQMMNSSKIFLNTRWWIHQRSCWSPDWWIHQLDLLDSTRWWFSIKDLLWSPDDEFNRRSSRIRRWWIHQIDHSWITRWCNSSKIILTVRNQFLL